MKTKPQKEMTLETITDYLNNNSLLKARSILADYKDASIKITGVISKIAKREGLLRFVVETTAKERKMTIFANFDSEKAKAKVKEMKIKKGKTVNLAGNFQTAGTEAICLNNCRLN